VLVSAGPCEELTGEPHMHVTLVKPGRDQNDTSSSNSEVMVTCDEGYHLNMESNKTAKCVKGRWKPVKPFCSIGESWFCSVRRMLRLLRSGACWVLTKGKDFTESIRSMRLLENNFLGDEVPEVKRVP